MQKEIVHVARGGYGGAISDLPEPMDLVFWLITHSILAAPASLVCD